MEDLDVEAAEKDSYADCPDSSKGSELKAVEEPALSEVEGSKDALNRLRQIRVRVLVFVLVPDSRTRFHGYDHGDYASPLKLFCGL